MKQTSFERELRTGTAANSQPGTEIIADQLTPCETGQDRKMEPDPTVTDPQLYKILFENDRVRVLRYTDKPGDRTQPHAHPDSVLITLSKFQRRLTVGDRTVDVEKSPHEVIWNAAQTHVGENTGTTDTDVIFVELK